MNPRALSRRELLAGVLALAGASAVPLSRGVAGERRALACEAAWLGQHAVAIGERYLRRRTAEADLDVLAELLLERVGGAIDDLPARLSAATREDFSRNDVVTVDGWLVSRTEARLCAIAHLARGAPDRALARAST